MGLGEVEDSKKYRKNAKYKHGEYMRIEQDIRTILTSRKNAYIQ